MPATTSSISFTDFTALTTAKSAEVNNNFSAFRGHLVCVDPTTSAFLDAAYDIGGPSNRWRDAYVSRNFYLGTPNTVGAWRIRVGDTTTQLVFEYYSATGYVEKGSFEA